MSEDIPKRIEAIVARPIRDQDRLRIDDLDEARCVSAWRRVRSALGILRRDHTEGRQAYELLHRIA